VLRAGLDRLEEVYLEHGALTWLGGIDQAPDAMYQRIRDSGTSTLAARSRKVALEAMCVRKYCVTSGFLTRCAVPLLAKSLVAVENGRIGPAQDGRIRLRHRTTPCPGPGFFIGEP